MMHRLWLCGIVAICLAGCTTTKLGAGRSLAAAQDAVAAGATGVHQAYVAGRISKAQVQQADRLVDQADDAAKAARVTYGTGDFSTPQATINVILNLAAQIVALEIPK